MESKTAQSKTVWEKIPFGIISGACGMFSFFATFGLIVAYVVMSGIAGQTADTVSFFENAWQTVLFVFDVIFAIVGIAALVMFVLKAKGVAFFAKKEAKPMPSDRSAEVGNNEKGENVR